MSKRPGTGLPSFGRTNYAACLGDSPYRGSAGGTTETLANTNGNAAQHTRAAQRGSFVPRQKAAFRDILDGLANTIMAGEITTDLGDRDTRTNPRPVAAVLTGALTPEACTQTGIDATWPQFWQAGGVTLLTSEGAANARGYRWADGNPVFSVMNTILPPNAATCIGDGPTVEAATGAGNAFTGGGVGAGARHASGYLPPSSRHQGGCHVLMGDGAVKFITDSIEAGNGLQLPIINGGAGARAPGRKSPYGLWGSLGSRASKEVIEESSNRLSVYKDNP